MSPSFLPGDYVLSLKLPFQWLRPDQVILVKHPELGLMIKRILTVNNQDPSRITDPKDEKCYLGPTDKNDPLWAIDGLTGCEFYQRYTGDAEKENVERVVKFFQDYENERRAM